MLDLFIHIGSREMGLNVLGICAMHFFPQPWDNEELICLGLRAAQQERFWKPQKTFWAFLSVRRVGLNWARVSHEPKWKYIWYVRSIVARCRCRYTNSELWHNSQSMMTLGTCPVLTGSG